MCKCLKGMLISQERDSGKENSQRRVSWGGAGAQAPGSPAQNAGPWEGASVATCLQEPRTLGRLKAEMDSDGVTLDLGLGLAGLESCGSGGPCLRYRE